MSNLHRALNKCKHPNSRKTKALSKQARRLNKKHKSRFAHAIKCNIVGEKLSWFVEHIDEARTQPLTAKEFLDLVELYLARFNEELQQIYLKQSISKNRANQHAARLDVITMTLKKENSDYKGCGLELLNLCDAAQFKALLDWDGSALGVQYLKLQRITQSMLQKLKQEQEADNNAENVTMVESLTSR